jgi:hypothetical protein
MFDNRKKSYKQYFKMTVEELAETIAEDHYAGADAKLKKLVYDHKVMERKHELDLKLLQEQAKSNKSLHKISIIGTVSAALIGAIVGGILQLAGQVYLQSKQPQKPKQPIQSQTDASTSEVHPGKITDKVPSPPPQK